MAKLETKIFKPAVGLVLADGVAPDGTMHCLHRDAQPELWNGWPLLCNGHWLLCYPLLDLPSRAMHPLLNKLWVDAHKKLFPGGIGVPASWRKLRGQPAVACEKCDQPAFEQVVPRPGLYVGLDSAEYRTMDEGCVVRSNGDLIRHYGMTSSVAPAAEHPRDSDVSQRIFERLRACLSPCYLIGFAEMGLEISAPVCPEEFSDGDAITWCTSPLLLTAGGNACGTLMPAAPPKEYQAW